MEGCSSKVPEPSAIGTSSGSTSSASISNATSAFKALPPKDVPYNHAADLTVTYASPSKGLGTNFSQPNCLSFTGSPAYKHGIANMTWTPGPSSATMDLVVTVGQAASTVRVSGAPPLSMTFACGADDAADNLQLLVSAQSDQIGAVAQQAVLVSVSFSHPNGLTIEPHEIICAF